jgi:hypothetical protein
MNKEIRQKDDSENRKELLQVRITREERNQLFQEAKNRGVTLSSLVRNFLINGKILN